MLNDDEIENMLKTNENDDDILSVDSCVKDLMNKFDSVQIFCTRHRQDCQSTISVHRGDGNWFARIGQIKEWVIKTDRSVND
jgi:hypothetical protein